MVVAVVSIELGVGGKEGRKNKVDGQRGRRMDVADGAGL